MSNELDDFTLEPTAEPIPGAAHESCDSEIQESIETVEDMQKEEPPIPAPALRKCLVCKEPLADWQQSLEGQKYHKNGKCHLCKYCGNEVGRDIILKCLEREDPISHAPCREKAMAEEFNSRPVTITQGHLNYLNRVIQFTYRPIPGQTIEELQALAVTTSNAYIKDMPMEDKFRHMKMMEAACANVSIAIHNDKERIRLAVEREDIAKHVKIRDLQKVHDASYIREKQVHDKEQANEKKRVATDPALRAREKTIVQMMGMGFTREAAETFIDKQKNAASGDMAK